IQLAFEIKDLARERLGLRARHRLTELETVRSGRLDFGDIDHGTKVRARDPCVNPAGFRVVTRFGLKFRLQAVGGRVNAELQTQEVQIGALPIFRGTNSASPGFETIYPVER